MTEIVASRFARQRAGAIRQGMRDYLKTLALIKEAWDQRDWDALGYADWQSYVDGEFGAERLGLTPQHRQKAVEELRLAGMSTRAIASAVGVDEKTVRNDLRGAEFSAPAEITGADGKRYAATRPTDSPAGRADTGGADQSGPDHPFSDAGEGPAPGPAAVVSQHSAIEAPAVAGPPAGAGDPLDDPEYIARQHREGSSIAVAEALVAIKMRLEPDPVRWLDETWIPGLYRFRDMPRVKDCFTAEGLRASAKYLDMLADHLDSTGETL